MKNFGITSLLISGLSVAQVSTPIKWACIGNSITREKVRQQAQEHDRPHAPPRAA